MREKKKQKTLGDVRVCVCERACVREREERMGG